jgi:hypothetical protein
MSREIAALAEHFADAPADFTTSALYRSLCPVVADDRPTLELLTRRRTGQQASFLFFGVVHELLLRGAPHPLRAYYPSVVGAATRDPAGAGPLLIDFCRRYRAELVALIETRLVQTNVVRRVVALRFALWAIGRSCRQPVHLIEVGASAGILLLVDRYRYLIGDREFGDPDAVVAVDSQWRGRQPPPDLDDVRPIASRIGIDLNPVDVTDADDRRWLRALVWPEDLAEAALLDATLDEVAKDPPTIITGDAIDICPALGRDLPPGEPRVVFHSATRMHVPVERRIEFDRAIDSIGADGPLYHVWLEPPSAPHHPYPGGDGGVVSLHGPDDERPSPLVRVDGHLYWLEPVHPGSAAKSGNAQ